MVLGNKKGDGFPRERRRREADADPCEWVLGHDQYLKFFKLLPVLKHHEALPVVSFFEKRTDAHHPWHRRLQPPIAREPGTEEA
ncbi:hypothetical protein ACCO45_001010 [Purpureocillium lilacinum]|uniref:Uncharacterized protein n=1 Tax=Purpureocillium lilacinum TaxID=33203 RepID=A0ACC4E5S5_PURLI